MFYIAKTSSNIVSKSFSQARTYFLRLLLVGLSLSIVTCSSPNECIDNLQIDSALQKVIFTSPEKAAQIFVDAIADNNVEALTKILGPNFQDILTVEAITSQDSTNFIAAWENKNSLITDEEGHYKLIVVGENQWTLPIPIIANDSGWSFDVERGSELINERRIGRNELNVIQVLLAYHRAQQEYAEYDHDGDGTLEYAQKLISSPGEHDGLFWEGNSSKTIKVLKELLAKKEVGGSYHGYYYKLFNTQDNDLGTVRFSLLAWPKSYEESGIMSFLINEKGIVSEQNLGSEGAMNLALTDMLAALSDWEETTEESLIQQ